MKKHALTIVLLSWFCLSAASSNTIYLKCTKWKNTVPFTHYSEDSYKHLVKEMEADSIKSIYLGCAVFYYPVNQEKFNVTKAKEDTVRGLLVYEIKNGKKNEFFDSFCVELNPNKLNGSVFLSRDMVCIIVSDRNDNEQAVWLKESWYGYYLPASLLDTFNVMQLGKISTGDFLLTPSYFYCTNKEDKQLYSCVLTGDKVKPNKYDRVENSSYSEVGLFYKELNEDWVELSAGNPYFRAPDTFFSGDSACIDSRFLKGPAAGVSGTNVNIIFCAVDEQGEPVPETIIVLE